MEWGIKSILANKHPHSFMVVEKRGTEENLQLC
jgi:hypothetical protein